MSGGHQLWRGIWVLGLAAWLAPALAQHWVPAGVPSWMIFPKVCYSDTLNDALYIGGRQFFNLGGVSYHPLYRYQNGRWDTLGLFGHSIETAIVYHDTLIVGGHFPTVYNDTIGRIACFVNGIWEPYGAFSSGVISRFRIINGELYAIGIFDNADGQFCNGLAKRVGGHWEPVGTLPAFNGDGSAWFQDAVWYQGRLVVTGNFTSADHTINDIMAYDGTSWQPVCQCLTGGFDGGGALAVYQGDLYLGGRYYFGPGNVGQGLMRWDGDQWYAVGQPGGGLQLYNYSDQYPPTVSQFIVRDGLLFVGGGYNYADHLTATGMATWDGSTWCSVGGTPDIAISCFDFFHDTLFIGCGANADGQLVNGVARFIGSSYQEECATTGISESETDVGLQVLSPRPGTIVLSGLSDGEHVLRVYDAQGRLVLRKQANSITGRTGEIEILGHQGPLRETLMGLYIIQVDELQRAKYIPAQ